MRSALFSFLFLFMGVFVFGQKSKLTVVIDNIKEIKGDIFIGLYDKAESFPTPGKFFKNIAVKVKGKIVKYTFDNLDKKNYAIALYHDENGDGKINKNFIGIPTEGYGFSRNFKPSISAPDFDQTKIKLEQDKEITISLIH